MHFKTGFVQCTLNVGIPNVNPMHVAPLIAEEEKAVEIWMDNFSGHFID